MQVPIEKLVEAEAAAARPVIDHREPDTGDASADRDLHEQLRQMAALHHARTARQD